MSSFIKIHIQADIWSEQIFQSPTSGDDNNLSLFRQSLKMQKNNQNIVLTAIRNHIVHWQINLWNIFHYPLINTNITIEENLLRFVIVEDNHELVKFSVTSIDTALRSFKIKEYNYVVAACQTTKGESIYSDIYLVLILTRCIA